MPASDRGYGFDQFAATALAAAPLVDEQILQVARLPCHSRMSVGTESEDHAFRDGPPISGGNAIS